MVADPPLDPTHTSRLRNAIAAWHPGLNPRDRPSPIVVMSLPPALASALQALLQARYGPEQREECAGWRGVFEEREGDAGSELVATRNLEAGEVSSFVCECMRAF